jgi:hypothetical protein
LPFYELLFVILQAENRLKYIPFIVTPAEYQQLKAFARIDGALLAIVWIGSFALYIKGLENPTLGMLSIMTLVVSPFFAAKCLRSFRNKARNGIISFARGYAYIVLIFFYSGLLFALTQYVYFTYMDNGFLMAKFTEMANSPESVQLGIKDMMQQSLDQMAAMRPIDLSLNVLTVIIVAGFFIGLPTAALLQQRVASNHINEQNTK